MTTPHSSKIECVFSYPNRETFSIERLKLFPNTFHLPPRSPRASVVLRVSSTYTAASLSVFSLRFFSSVPLGSDADLVAQSAGFLRDSDYSVSLPITVLTLNGE